MKKENFKTITISVLSGLALSYFYDKIGFKFLDFIFSKSSICFVFFKNEIAITASNIAYQGNSYFSEILFLTAITIASVWFFDLCYTEYKTRFSKKETSESSECFQKKSIRFLSSKSGVLLLCALYLFVTLFLLTRVIIVTSATSLSNLTTQNIEIVSPYIDDMEYKQLKSSLLQVDSYSDFNKLHNRIIEIADENNVVLKNGSIYQNPYYKSNN